MTGRPAASVLAGAVTTLVLIVALGGAAHAGQPATGIVQGTVIDGAGGQPLARVLILDEGNGQSTLSDAEGRFALTLPVGARQLRASAVGFVLVRREVRIVSGDRILVTIPLTGGTGTYVESVTVAADPFRRTDSAAPALHVLDSGDIQNLRGVLADDPLRAVQAVSGAATGDDLRSEFSIRGSDFNHLNFTVDGFSTPFLLHTVRAIEDHSNSGSVAMINSDVLQDATVENGGYAQRTGNRTGAAVALRLREGTRARTELRGAVSATSLSAVVEGPIGSEARGSWLISGRYSYLDRLIDRLTDDGLRFGFSDAQAKVVFDVTRRQRLDLTVVAGRSRLAQPVENVDEDDLFAGRNASTVGIARWRLATHRALIAAGALGGSNRFTNDTVQGIVLDRGTERQATARLDAQYQASSSVQVEAGLLGDWRRERRVRQRLASGALSTVNEYAGNATRVGAHAMLRWHPRPNVTVSPGVRVDHWTLVRSAKASPWLQAAWQPAAAVTLRGGAGVYRQSPELEQVLGAWSAANPRLEQAAQFDVGAEWRLAPFTRVQVTLFDRQDQDVMRRAGAETRVDGALLVRASSTARFANRLDGFARGVEGLVQVGNPNGLSGWLAYAYGRNRYHDDMSQETFWGNFDQRHTFNAYAGYRLSARTSLSVKLRMGSSFPVPGYFGERDGRTYVIDRKNELRLPVYTRLDLRANRTFAWSRHRVTLFAEVINVLDRANVRFSPPSIDSRTREARRLYESMIPIVPSAGVLIEF